MAEHACHLVAPSLSASTRLSPLFTKLNKKYWELPHVAGKPLILAIQDFHTAGALMTSDVPLVRYLYGLGQTWWHDEDAC